MKFEVFSPSLTKQEITFTSQNGKICHILLHHIFYNIKSQSFLRKRILRFCKSRIIELREEIGKREQTLLGENKRPNFCGVSLKITLGERFEGVQLRKVIYLPTIDFWIDA